jgi:hypothetical protein
MKTYLKTSKVSNKKQQTLEQLAKGIELLAINRLRKTEEKFDQSDIDREIDTISQCLEYLYIKEDHDKTFAEFVSDYMITNIRKILHQELLIGAHLEEVFGYHGKTFNGIYAVNESTGYGYSSRDISRSFEGARDYE